MGRFRLSALLGAALFIVPSAAATAADIPEIPYIDPAPVDVGGGWYLRGHIGLAAQQFKGLDHELFGGANQLEWLDKGNFAGVPTFGVGVGFRASENLRFDVTGEYRSKSAFKARDRHVPGSSVVTNDYSGFKSEWLVLANAYYDIGTWNGITPYVGAGIGASYNTISNFTDAYSEGGGGWAPTGSQWSLAWALHAGASMQVTDRMSIDLGYSFVNLGDAKTGAFQNVDPAWSNCLPDNCTPMKFKSLYSHDIKLGVRWSLDGGSKSTDYNSGFSNFPVVAKY